MRFSVNIKMIFVLNLLIVGGLMTLFASAAPAVSFVNHKISDISDISDGVTDISRAHVGTSLRLHAPRFAPKGFIKCKTSNASPSETEILGLIAELKVKGSCKQNNALGSKCTKLASFHGGDASICGGHKDWMTCLDAASAVEQILNTCLDNKIGRSGGEFNLFHKALRVVVH